MTFRKLTLNNIRLRYQKHHHQGLTQPSGDSNNYFARNRSDNTKLPYKVGWNAVWENIKVDVQELEKWETDWWWRLFRDEPQTPWLEYWRDLARSIWFCLEEVISQIKYRENETSKTSNLESLRREGNMIAVARILAQDRKALRRGVVDIETEQTRNEMLDALEDYEKRYFVYIDIEEGRGRYSGMVEYELTPEERQRIDKIHTVREQAFEFSEPLPLVQLGSLVDDETLIIEDGSRYSQSQIVAQEKGPRMLALEQF
ncbi:hypothetical protein BDZ45DRAFT_689901 [Acephala macrosclerotiorum]|nr:hypothetical protein BDZ45DRAFT_689901 [Acephala macrosclerotiorum]